MKKEEKAKALRLPPQIVDWDNAILMHVGYGISNKRLLIKNSKDDYETLCGFNIPLDLVNQVMDDDKDNADNIFLGFGIKPNGAVTTIVAGATSADTLIKTSLYDFLDPCPESCPKNKPEHATIAGEDGQVINWSEQNRKKWTRLKVGEAYELHSEYHEAPDNKVILSPILDGTQVRVYGFWLHPSAIDALRKKKDFNGLYLMLGIKLDELSDPNAFLTLMCCGVDTNFNIFTDAVYHHLDVCIGYGRIPTNIFTCIPRYF